MDAAAGLWLRTALLALAAVAGACLLALPAGWILARHRGRGRGMLLGLVLALAVLPTTLSAIGWISVLGAQGLLPWPRLYAAEGVVLVWAMSYWPLVALGLWGGLSRREGGLEEAALLAMPPWRAALGVVLPRALPVALSAAAAAWILMLGDLGVPGCLQVPVGAEAVHAAFSARWDAGEALGLCLPALALALGACLAARTGLAALSAGGGEGAAGMAPLVRTALLPAWILALGTLAAPAWGLAGWALQGGGFAKALALMGREGMVTLSLSAVTGLLAAGAGFAVAFGLSRRPALMGAASLASILAFALPGTLAGAGLILVLNGPGWRGALYASPAILLLAALLRASAPAVLMARRGLAALPASLDESARLCGIPAWRRAAGIALPLCRGSLLAGGLVAALVAAGEVGAAALVSPPGVQTLACRLFSLIHYGADGVVGAVALMGMAAALLAGMGLARASGRLGSA